MSGSYSSPLFVGRERELRILRQHLEAARRGRGGVVLLAGEQGIGKTRLLAEFAEGARLQGWQVLRGRAFDAEGTPPYLPFVEALRICLRAGTAHEFKAQLGRAATDLALLLPELNERFPAAATEVGAGAAPSILSPQPSSERYQFFENVSGFFRRVAATRGPLLLLLDDLHWADRPSLLLLQHLARSIGTDDAAPELGSCLLIAGAYRTVDIGRGHALQSVLANLRRERLAETLPLGSFTPAESAVLIARLAGQTSAAAIAASIHAETGGNPFFVEEVVRHLQEKGQHLAGAGAEIRDWGVPEGVRQVIAARLARLSPEANQILQAAAVLGDGFRFDVLADSAAIFEGPLPAAGKFEGPLPAAGKDVGALLDALDEVLIAGILHEEREAYSFSHALIREAVYSALSLPRRQLFHLQAARALEIRQERGEAVEAATIALHYRQAGPTARDQARRYAELAAEAAGSVYAWEEAAAHYEAALSLLPSQAEAKRCQLLLALGEAQVRIGESRTARDTFRQAAAVARRLGEPDQLGRAALGFGATAGSLGLGDRNDELVGLLQEALAALGDAETSLRVRLLGRLTRALYWTGDPEQRLSLSHQAVEVARGVGDSVALARALWARYWTLRGPDGLEQRMGLAAEALRLADTSGDRELALLARRWRLHDLLELGEIAAVEAAIEEYARLAGELRQPYHLWYLRVLRVTQALLRGRFDEGERLLGEAFALGERIDEDEAADYRLAQQYALFSQQGRLGEIEAALQKRAEGENRVLAWRCMLVYLQAELGRLDQAKQGFAWLAAEDFSRVPRDGNWLNGLSLLAATCGRLGTPLKGPLPADGNQQAARLYDLLLPYAARAVVLPVACDCRGAVARSLGLLATLLERWDEAAAHFDAAVAMNRRLGMPAWLAQTQCDYAAMLLARTEDSGLRTQESNRERASAFLHEALATAEALGLVPLLEQVRDLTSSALRRPEADDVD